MARHKSEFEGYGKIAESADRWGLDASAYRRLSRARWAVTEKIHGANFCFVCDEGGARVRGASRRELLPETYGFFGWQAVRDAMLPPLAATFEGAARLVPGLRCVYVYGELFGGAYPHPDVPAVPGAQPVQTGVWYTPDVRFCAFDLAVEGADGSRRYLDFEAALGVWRAAGLFCAEPLRLCGYADALAFPLGFDSTISRRLDLPPLPPGTNRAEGVVVRPLHETVLETSAGPLRPLLKRKIVEFSEDARYSQAQKWEAPAEASGEYEMLKWEATALVNDNRVAAAISKVGYREARREPSRARLVFRLVADEVWDELAAAGGDRLSTLSGAERENLRTHIGESIRAVMRRLAHGGPRRL